MTMGDDIIEAGVDDYISTLFEGQFIIPEGMSYNSYVIMDSKIAVIDTVEKNFCGKWMENLNNALMGRTPDYLIVQHMEPDHSGCILPIMAKYPQLKIVASKKAFEIMRQFYGYSYEGRQIVVDDATKVDLGRHKLSFIQAPMVHWPEVIMTYDEYSGYLFSADAFGKFGASDSPERDMDSDWACEARRYYFGILGKYGANVQNVLERLKKLKIRAICPLHGPVLKENLNYYINLYDIWSSNKSESDAVCICYTSVYGNTRRAAQILCEKLKALGCEDVTLINLADSDMAEAVEDAFRCNKLVLATTTYNGEIFPLMQDFILRLAERNYGNRTVGFIENGSWAPAAIKHMRKTLDLCDNLSYTAYNVSMFSSLSEQNMDQLTSMAIELANRSL